MSAGWFGRSSTFHMVGERMGSLCSVTGLSSIVRHIVMPGI